MVAKFQRSIPLLFWTAVPTHPAARLYRLHQVVGLIMSQGEIFAANVAGRHVRSRLFSVINIVRGGTRDRSMRSAAQPGATRPTAFCFACARPSRVRRSSNRWLEVRELVSCISGRPSRRLTAVRGGYPGGHRR